MIKRSELTEIGTALKTHGINGELNVVIPVDVDLDDLSCLIIDMDGIFVPFFIENARQRGADGYIVKFEGITSDLEGAEFRGKTIYALSREVVDGEISDDGLYADDLIGYRVTSTDALLKGEIEDIDASTANVLFVVRTDDGKTCLVPVAEEFIDNIDSEKSEVTFNIPEGLLDL